MTCAHRLQGAQRQGIRTHIRTKKKFDNSGVGQVESARQAQDWTSDMVNFSAVLGSLKEVVARRVDAVDSSDDDDGDDAEPAAAHRKPAAAPAAESTQRGERHAAALAKGSSKRKRSATAETAADASTPTVAAAASSAAAAPPAPVAEKRATHSGRYAKRARNKMVKGYSATDLAAILGGTTGATGALFTPCTSYACAPQRASAWIGTRALCCASADLRAGDGPSCDV